MKEGNIEQVINKLKSQKKLGHSTILFLGAGASVTSGIPTANSIIEYIKENYSSSYTMDENSDDYIHIMEQLYPADRRKIFKHFIKDAKINETHLITALLLYHGFVDVVVTTNFDPLLKRASTLLRLELPIIDIANNVTTRGQQISIPTIYYLHGDYSNVWQLNTKDELNKKRDEIRHLFTRISINRTWIIIGYSGNDPVFELLTEYEKFENGLFWIGYQFDEPEDHVKNLLLKDKTKNTFYIKGFDSDKFFIELIKGLDILSTNFGLYLEKVLIQTNAQIKLHQDKSLRFTDKINPIHLTENCRKWINEVKNYHKKAIFTVKDNSIISKLFNWIFNRFFKYKFIYSLIAKKEYDNALDYIDYLIDADTNDFTAHYYKGIVLCIKAEILENPTDRKSYYERARASWDTAKGLILNQDESPKELQELNDTIMSFYAEEYNRGVNIQKDENLFNTTPDPYRTSMVHFENAAVINPDDAMTYQVMASTYYQLEDIKNAINSYEKALSLMDRPKIDDFEFIISLYLKDNRNEEALTLSQKALKHYPDETSFVQFLSDAYIQSGQWDEAVELIEGLIEEEPDNPRYHRVLGTRVYQLVDQLTSEVNELYREMFDLNLEARNLSGSDREAIDSKIDEMEVRIEEKEEIIHEKTEVSLREMNRVVELEPESESANFILAIIYQNRAANIFERKNNVVNDSDLVAEYDRRARENLEQARIYYEKATEINPENTENWQSLFQVFTQLGMEEEALDAKEKADLT